MIAMFVSKQNPIELRRRHAAFFEAQDNLPRAQPTVDQYFAMIGRNKRAVPRAAAPEHRQTEHDLYLATGPRFSQI